MNSADQASRTDQAAGAGHASRTEHVSAEVVVELESCATQDAHAVFSALRTSFSSDRAADDVPVEVTGHGSTVWTTTFDVSELKAAAEPRRLTAPVTVGLQGGYWAVDQLCKALAPAFTVHILGMAAGDQEKEVELRLESRR